MALGGLEKWEHTGRSKDSKPFLCCSEKSILLQLLATGLSHCGEINHKFDPRRL